MSVSSIAFLPHPPVLLPGLTGRPVAEVEALRLDCLGAVVGVLRTRPDEIVLLGSTRPGDWSPPLSMAVGHALLAEAEVDLPVTEVVVAADGSADDIAAAARVVEARPGNVGLLVMGDGSARRTLKAPGYLDERAAAYDSAIELALSEADPAGLAQLDRTLADRLLVAGWVPWQVAAAVAASSAASSGPWQPELMHTADPFGVFYAVALWGRSGESS